MKELILPAVLLLAVQLSEGETPLDSWLCDVLRAQTPETRLDDFPDEGASEAPLARRREGEIEEWAIVSSRYRVRLRYRQPGGSALRTGFELSIASTSGEGPFLFASAEEAERWLGRLGERVEEREEGVMRYSETREGTVNPHFQVTLDLKERFLEIFWEEKWLVDHPSPLYRRFGPDYRERLCPVRAGAAGHEPASGWIFSPGVGVQRISNRAPYGDGRVRVAGPLARPSGAGPPLEEREAIALAVEL